MFKDNPDFYPTPENMQRKLFSKIDWKYVNNCLEPSAGAGHLIEGIEKQFQHINRYNRNKKFDIDAIEQDQNLVHVLKGKGHRVIYNDFLSFQSFKSYDCIVANFPFSTGEKHAIRAIELAENQIRSCQLSFLINAETLHNPYTNTRKELINKLDKYNADVEFIDNAFVNAERQTGVSVALISLTVKKQEYNSILLNELKQEEEQYNTKQYNSDMLIHSDFIDGIVSQYNYEIKAGLKLIQEYEALKPLILNSFEEHNRPILKLELEYKDDSSSLENAYIRQIRAKYWKALFSNEQFMSLFTSNLRRKFIDKVDELKDYDFSFYNIYTLRIELSKEMTQGIEDTILNLFEEFSYKHYFSEGSKNIHYFSGWRTNKAYKINKRVIIPLNSFDTWDGKFRPDYRVIEKLNDVEKVFNYLDGGNTPEIDLREALKFAEAYGETKKIETKYFYVTFYKKQTCHIEFKDEEILKKFNIFGANKRGFLPPVYGKAKYKDMTREEKDAINEFEGEQSYNKVMANQSYYIVETSDLLRLTS